MSFLENLQRDRKVKSVRKKMSAMDKKRTALSREYKRAVKAASVKLRKKKGTTKRKPVKRRRRY